MFWGPQGDRADGAVASLLSMRLPNWQGLANLIVRVAVCAQNTRMGALGASLEKPSTRGCIRQASGTDKVWGFAGVHTCTKS